MSESKRVTYKDIFDLNLKHIDYLLSKSYLTHQYFQNISISGDQIEIEIRSIFSKLLPKRYKITHGYIASAVNNTDEPLVSPQIDMIIVDTLVPHSLYTFDNEMAMELVPIESVVGIFEIKRTLDKVSFKKALAHLYKIQSEMKISKTDDKKYFPTGIEGLGVLPSNPLLGILSLSHEKEASIENYKDIYLKIMEKSRNNNEMPDLDICACLGDFFISTCDNGGKNMWAHIIREKGKSYPYLFKIRGDLVSQNKESLSAAYFLSVSIGFIMVYLTLITGRQANLGNYFFNNIL